MLDIQSIISSSINLGTLTIEPAPFKSEGVGALKLKPPRKPLFGNEETAKVYRAAKDLAIKHNIFRMCRVREEGEYHQLIICNLWRIDRHADKSIATFEFDLAEQSWKEVSDTRNWPEMPFYPITKTTSLSWWRTIISQALGKVLDAAGFKELPTQTGRGTSAVSKGLPPYKMYDIFKEFYLGRYKLSEVNKGKWVLVDGLLKSSSMEAGARALRAAFFDHVYDSCLMSAILVVDYTKVSFPTYLTYARHREGFMKVAHEHRNLLPLLPYINPSCWGMDDLFSRKLWVKDGRKSTKLDRRPISIGKEGIKSFDTVTAWRWMLKASPVVLCNWANFKYKSSTMLTNIALANINVKAPVLAYAKLVKLAYRLEVYGVSEAVQRLIRVYLHESARVWKEEGFKVVRPWIHQNADHIGSVIDYLDAEGFDLGYPSKKCTWTQLLNRANEWHLRLELEELESQLERGGVCSWTSCVSETVIDDIVFTPITSAKSLIIEGHELKHCVGGTGYIYGCTHGHYMVFSVKDSDGARSTLGLSIVQGEVWVDQHRGFRNRTVSKKADKAGNKLASIYGEALRGS